MFRLYMHLWKFQFEFGNLTFLKNWQIGMKNSLTFRCRAHHRRLWSLLLRPNIIPSQPRQRFCPFQEELIMQCTHRYLGIFLCSSSRVSRMDWSEDNLWAFCCRIPLCFRTSIERHHLFRDTSRRFTLATSSVVKNVTVPEGKVLKIPRKNRNQPIILSVTHAQNSFDLCFPANKNSEHPALYSTTYFFKNIN
jgi:hypothetical protein